MIEQFNRQLSEIKEQLRYKEKWENRLDYLESIYQESKNEVERLKEQWEKEELDVKKLEKITLTNLLYSISGRKLEKLDKEQKEKLQAKLKYELKEKELIEIEKEINEVKNNLQKVADAKQKYEQILREKEAYLKRTHSSWSEKLEELTNKISHISIQLKEYDEAIQAGEKASQMLTYAIDQLDQAKNWSTWDMFGGGFIASSIKHSSIEKANQMIKQAHDALRKFQMELNDVKIHFHQQISIDQFLTFADYFLDSIIVDWMVHEKIRESYDHTIETAKQVRKMIDRLVEQKTNLSEILLQLQKNRKRLIESVNDFNQF